MFFILYVIFVFALNIWQEKELESEVDVRDQQRSILCKLSALKTELSKVSELHPGLVTSSKDERIAERQRSILKVIRALKEEVHRIAELQEREKAKVTYCLLF